jgi:SOS response regulatory protein OraA/RecX
VSEANPHRSPQARALSKQADDDEGAASPADLEARAWRAAVAILARRDMAAEELRRALLAKAHSEAAVEAALDRLRRERTLDDAALAARYARSRLQYHGQGQHRVRQGLRRKGVTGAIMEAGIREALGEVSESGVLDRLARRYWTQRRRDAPARRLRGLWAFLVRRGFPATLVHERLRKLWPRWSDALEGLEPEAEA